MARCYPEQTQGITDLKSVRNRVQAWYTMLPRSLSEAKNTVEHDIAARERAHSVHMKIILPDYLLDTLAAPRITPGR